MLDGSDSGEINAIAITKEGENFVSGGEDKLIKVWDYDEGICYYTGVGHSGHITRVYYNLTSMFIKTYSIDFCGSRSEDNSECGNRRCNFHLAHPREGAES